MAMQKQLKGTFNCFLQSYHIINLVMLEQTGVIYFAQQEQPG